MEKIDRMLEEDLFDRTNLDRIRSLARESVVHAPIFIDENNSHLLIRSNERLEMLVDRIKSEISMFIENAEQIRGLIDLKVIDSEMQLAWKNELIQMQGQLSSYQMDILTYYRNRSDIGVDILKQAWINDCQAQLIEKDEDLFFQLRMISIRLKSFYHQLYQIVSRWVHS